jgi:hypothetical protein
MKTTMTRPLQYLYDELLHLPEFEKAPPSTGLRVQDTSCPSFVFQKMAGNHTRFSYVRRVQDRYESHICISFCVHGTNDGL